MCFIAVLERYGQRLAPACGLLGGFGLNEGALAATVSHDSHNIVVIGRSAEEMALAVNQVIQDGGGLCVVRNGCTKSSTVAHCRANEHRHGAVTGGAN